MYQVFACLAYEHNIWLVLVAATVCVIGSCLTVLLIRRMMRATGHRRYVQLGVSSMMAGATIWSTHFIAMLAYEPGYSHAYEPFLTGVSLAIAIFGTLFSNAIMSIETDKPVYLLAGALFGLTISTMHYFGMAAYQLPGEIVWQPQIAVASIVLGVIAGMLCFYRIARPVTRYCWIGGAILMILAICMMHFTAMGAIEIQLSPLIEVPAQAISDSTLGMLIVAVMTVILIFGFASVSIELNLEQEARDTLQHAVRHDALTGLPNRMGLNQHLDEILVTLEADQTFDVAVLTIDLNLFKQVNDLYGHAAGDKVLTTIAGRLSDVLDKNEYVARAGGDEFIATKQGIRRVDQVVAFAERLLATIVEPILLDDISTTVGAAIGVTTSLEDGRDLLELQQQSDLAMYRAKAEPDRHICFYSAELDMQSQDRAKLIYDLGFACENDEFELFYQLQNDIHSLEPVGFEALLRWNHPLRGRVSPNEFIPVAEETGLIRKIGLWVLLTACHEASKWPSNFSIAVNVAPQQLVQPTFVDQIADILHETGLPPERLELEITEASIIDDQAHTLKVMSRIKAMGIRIAMDDFGTGYSSLATLQAFPFDKIKIDRSFIKDVHENKQSAAIVRSTLLLGAALDIPVLAEGVEMKSELDFLKSENCASVQGFYFGKPMPIADVNAIIFEVEKKSA